MGDERRRGRGTAVEMARLVVGWAVALLAASAVGPEAPAQAPSGGEASTAAGEGEGAGFRLRAPEDESLDFIETDRNSLTPSTRLPRPGTRVLETAYTYLNFPESGIKHSFPESLFRYGLTERVELRLGWNYETGGDEEVIEGDISDFFGANAEQQIYYGFKSLLIAQQGRRPDVAVLVQGHTPTGGPATATQLRAGVISGWVLPNDWIFDWSLTFGTDSLQGDRYEVWFPTAVLKVPFARNRWFTHIEYFGAFSSNKGRNFASNFLDTGLHHLLTPNIEVGFIIGMELQANPGYFVETGLGVRF